MAQNKKHAFIMIGLLLSITALAGCGKKGPLYLPGYLPGPDKGTEAKVKQQSQSGVELNTYTTDRLIYRS
ncbi:MAG: lipoprotein [Gammaproteobacteria bacterium]|nr:lipoprotein [Gammaproteobacteria bacterium]